MKMKLNKNTLIMLLVVAVILGIGAWRKKAEMPKVPQAAPPETLEVHFIDVGQANAALLRTNDCTILIDGGNVEDGSLLVSYLQAEEVERIDLVVGTHAHEDHIGGLAAVLARFEVGSVWCPVTEYSGKPFADFKKYAEEQLLELEMPELGRTYDLNKLKMTVLGPRADYPDEPNNTSIVLRFDYGECSFLFAGDAERESENAILDAGCDVDVGVLLAGHHGSNTSNSYRWLLESSPQTAIISCGADNEYGHPHEEVLSRFADAEIDVLRTDMQGHIVCVCDGESYSYYTQYKPSEPTNPAAKYTGVYIGNSSSGVFHRESCSGLPGENKRVYFDTRAEAEAEGFTPHHTCNQD